MDKSAIIVIMLPRNARMNGGFTNSEANRRRTNCRFPAGLVHGNIPGMPEDWNLGDQMVIAVQVCCLDRKATALEQENIHLFLTELLDEIAMVIQPNCQITIGEMTAMLVGAWEMNVGDETTELITQARADADQYNSWVVTQMRRNGTLLRTHANNVQDERNIAMWAHLQFLTSPQFNDGMFTSTEIVN